MNIELRWVERGQPNGPQPQSIRVLQYREPMAGAPRVAEFYEQRDAYWTDWRDVPVVTDGH